MVPKGKSFEELAQRLGGHEVAANSINLTPGLILRLQLMINRSSVRNLKWHIYKWTGSVINVKEPAKCNTDLIEELQSLTSVTRKVTGIAGV